HRDLGRARLLDVAPEGLAAAYVVRLADRGPEREALHDDADAEHRQRHPPPAALDRVRVGELVPGLVQREAAAEREQDDRDDERVHVPGAAVAELMARRDRKSTRLNSSHVKISYAVFCLKKK